MSNLIHFTDKGMYVPLADVYIDPWKPVARAIITHAHSDHARWGMGAYLCHHQTIPVLKKRLGDNNYQVFRYGEEITINGVKFNFYPAGHVLGSAQIRVEYGGDVWVASGDYKLQHDGISAPFEAVKCNTFITESTFGLPVYNWKPQAEVINEINAWWKLNQEKGKCSVIFAYSLGKAQRIIHNVDHALGDIFVHGSVENMNTAYSEAGIALKPCRKVSAGFGKEAYRNALIVAPPSADGSEWMRKFEPYSTALASGWMALRGARRRGAVDRGFVLSDHADWGELNTAVKATGATRVIVTHGYTSVFSQWLREQGLEAFDVETQFSGESIDEDAIKT